VRIEQKRYEDAVHLLQQRYRAAAHAEIYTTYGPSRIAGLAPIDMRVPRDTIDPCQSDRTHTAVFVASDAWQITNCQQLQFSEYFRTYGLEFKVRLRRRPDSPVRIPHRRRRERFLHSANQDQDVIHCRLGFPA
jgi:hypothetical protein